MDAGAEFAGEELLRDTDGPTVFEIDDDPGPGSLGVDSGDGAPCAVAEVAVGLAGRVELLGGRAADDFVTGLEVVRAGMEDGTVQLPVGGEEDAGTGVEGATLAVMLCDHARRCVGWVAVTLLSVDPPVGGELVEKLFGVVGEHDAVVCIEPVEGLRDEPVAVLAERESQLGEVGAGLAA